MLRRLQLELEPRDASRQQNNFQLTTSVEASARLHHLKSFCLNSSVLTLFSENEPRIRQHAASLGRNSLQLHLAQGLGAAEQRATYPSRSPASETGPELGQLILRRDCFASPLNSIPCAKELAKLCSFDTSLYDDK